MRIAPPRRSFSAFSRVFRGGILSLLVLLLITQAHWLIAKAPPPSEWPDPVKSSKEISLRVGDRATKVVATFYRGSGRRHPVVVESQGELNKLLLSYQHRAPKIDFDRSFVLFVPGTGQAEEESVDVNGLSFTDGKFHSVQLDTAAGSEPTSDRPFVIVVVPKTALK